MRRLRDWGLRHESLAGVLVLAGILAAYFWPLLLGRQMGQSHVLWSSWPWLADRPSGDVRGFSGEGDAAVVFHPLLTVARAQLHAGRLPLWDPYAYGGMVLHGDIQSALLFPVTWIGLLLPVEWAWGIMCALKLLIAGAGAYTLARALGRTWGAGVLAGAIYMLAGPNVAWLQWPLTTVYALFPWLLLATERLYRRPGQRTTAGLAVVVGLSILAGHPETAVLSSSAVAVYLVARAFADRPRREPRALLRAAALWLGGHALGMALAGAALVPFYAAYRESITLDAHGAFSALHLPASSGILYALPDVYGNGRPVYYGPVGTYVITVAYCGLAALLLAGIAFARRGRHPVAIGLAAMTAVATMAAFGVPPASWITRHVPPYSTGNNVRVLHVAALAIALGAAAGVDLLSRRPLAVRRLAIVLGGSGALVLAYFALDKAAGALDVPRHIELHSLLRFPAALAAAAAVVWALGRRPRSQAVALAVAVAVLDLAHFQSYNRILPPEQAYPARTATLNWLAVRRGDRISVIRPGPFPPYVLPPNTSALSGLEDVQGYDYPESKRWADFSWYVLDERGPQRELIFNSPRTSDAALTGLRMMNTRWYLAPPGQAAPNPEFRRVRAARDGSVWEDPRALPRAYVVPRALPTANALAVLRGGRFDPRAAALVEPGAPPAPRGTRFMPARFERVAEDHFRVHLPPGAAGWLVVANAWAPGWEATVDGRPRGLHPTNDVAMGLPVRAGERVVDVRYRPASVPTGAALSLVGLLLTAGLWRRGRRANGASPRSKSNR